MIKGVAIQVDGAIKYDLFDSGFHEPFVANVLYIFRNGKGIYLVATQQGVILQYADTSGERHVSRDIRHTVEHPAVLGGQQLSVVGGLEVPVLWIHLEPHVGAVGKSGKTIGEGWIAVGVAERFNAGGNFHSFQIFAAYKGFFVKREFLHTVFYDNFL